MNESLKRHLSITDCHFASLQHGVRFRTCMSLINSLCSLFLQTVLICIRARLILFWKNHDHWNNVKELLLFTSTFKLPLHMACSNCKRKCLAKLVKQKCKTYNHCLFLKKVVFHSDTINEFKRSHPFCFFKMSSLSVC